MKNTVAILALSIASALGQKPASDPAKPRVVPDILDLKATMVKFEEDGIFMPKICLTATKSRVLFSEPSGFTLAKDAPIFTLVSKEDRTATVSIQSSPRLILPLVDEAQRKAVRDSFAATAPKDADRVEIISEAESPFPINGWKTFQFTMSYGLFGQTFKRQLVFVQLHPFQELQFIAQAPDRLFPAATAAMNTVLRTWYREPQSLVAGAGKPTPE